ncbi:MAG: acyl-CoA reductase-like NAD-dependent aldehyde dehydrogenase [Saprospiraceae bacterium]|jgi:acyl-CoA reductase-like NAD-dependent aldehyde dehydrogenase
MKTQNYIAGQWRDGATTVTNVNPSDLSDVIGEYAQATHQDLDDALAAAEAGQIEWAKTGLEHRYNVLMAIGNEMIGRAAELGETLSREEGKTKPEGFGEMYRSGQFFTYYAAEVLRQMGEVCDSVRPGIEVEARREPVGVVAIVTPWNFPMACAAWKIAPALAYGNSVIWKPANITPATACNFAEIMSRQGLPDGVFNLVMGAGATIGDAMVSSPIVKAVTFTGSLNAGKKIAANAVSNLAKVQLEMGSKNALYVDASANMTTAVDCAVNGAYGSTGQKCTASSRLIVHKDVHDEFVAAVTERVKALKVGPALEEGSQIGPVVSEAQIKQNEHYLQVGQDEGATLVCGGERLEMGTAGYYMAPALFVGGKNDMTINRDEIFGPIACVIKVDSYDEALEMVNDTQFGLTAGIITESLANANHFKHNAKSGCVMINLPTAGTDYHVPFGGRKNSSYGSREQGKYAAEFYTVVKTTYMKAY